MHLRPDPSVDSIISMFMFPVRFILACLPIRFALLVLPCPPASSLAHICQSGSARKQGADLHARYPLFYMHPSLFTALTFSLEECSFFFFFFFFFIYVCHIHNHDPQSYLIPFRYTRSLLLTG